MRNRGYGTQLGIAKKKVNGKTVGFVLGFVDEDNYLCSVRRNLIFKSKEDAEKVLKTIEDNTEVRYADFVVIKRGERRFRD